MLKLLSRHMYYSFLDGISGYFQIIVALEDLEKTMFTCHYSSFANHRIPFGLCNDPTTFQRYIMSIFYDLVEDIMEVFMDKVFVFGDFLICVLVTYTNPRAL